MGKNQHVVPYGNRWAVRIEGNTRVSAIHRTQSTAIRTARRSARKEESDVIIYNRNGKTRGKNGTKDYLLLSRVRHRLIYISRSSS